MSIVPVIRIAAPNYIDDLDGDSLGLPAAVFKFEQCSPKRFGNGKPRLFERRFPPVAGAPAARPLVS